MIRGQSQLPQSIDEVLTTSGLANGELDFHSTVDTLQQLSVLLASAIEELKFSNVPDLDTDVDFYAEVRRFEIGLIMKALKCVNGSQLRAARILNLKATTLNSKMKLYGIDSLPAVVPLAGHRLLKSQKS